MDLCHGVNTIYFIVWASCNNVHYRPSKALPSTLIRAAARRIFRSQPACDGEGRVITYEHGNEQ